MNLKEIGKGVEAPIAQLRYNIAELRKETLANADHIDVNYVKGCLDILGVIEEMIAPPPLDLEAPALDDF